MSEKMDVQDIESDAPIECPFKKRKLEETDSCDNIQADSITDDIETLGDVNKHEMSQEEVDTVNENDMNKDENDDEEAGSDYSSDSDVNYEEIESMLDERLPEELKNKKKEYEERFKTIMEEKGRNHFEMLPEGWVQVTHDSGMPLYLHRQSRVCSVSRPYFLGPGSVRKHEIPISSIPCLNYTKSIEREKELIEQQRRLKEQHERETALASENSEQTEETTANGLSKALNLNNKAETIVGTKSMLLPTCIAKVETVSENLKEHSLTPAQFTDYCKKLFHFKTIRVMRFKSWSARRKFTKNRKHIKHLQRPTLPNGTKLITFPVLNTEIQADTANGQTPAGNTTVHQRPKKEYVMNPNGKSYVCILHEYVQHALKKQPTYEFKELENSATPYSATVSINNLKYGTGYGTSKKQAKSEAARETLEVLIPEMREKITGLDKTNSSSSAGNKPSAASTATSTASASTQDLSVFDEIRIEDPRVPEFCLKTTEPSPHSILLTCLQRNYGLGNIQVKYEVNTAKHKKNEYTMTVGQHVAKVYCKNKRDGKQRASQAILQMLHPNLMVWGSLLRLYGNRSVKSFKEKKQEEQEITVLQTRAAVNQPNYAILDKLKTEMLKLKELKENAPGGQTSIQPPPVLSVAPSATKTISISKI